MVLISSITLLYVILILLLLIGFNRLALFKDIDNKSISFSILIPFRNEGENISLLADSLKQLDYPTNNFEIIWINDGSTDNSVPLLTEYLVKNRHWKLLDNVRTSNSPKKDAITLAIQQAKNSWIITTDADCEVSINWLNSFASFIAKNKHTKLIAGPVTYKTDTSFLQHFQQLDFLSLIGTTIGSFGIGKPFMCNGANLCYRKSVFLKVNGFVGNNTISSGDDVFLLEKISAQYPTDVHYLKSKEALVITKPQNTFKGLVNQRIRWASKTGVTNNWFGKIVGLLVLLMNMVVVYSLVMLRNSNSKSPLIYVFLILLKFGFDYLLIKKTHQFIGLQKKNYYIASSFVYPVFVVYIVVNSLFKKGLWKG